jgi:hypothetical protein
MRTFTSCLLILILVPATQAGWVEDGVLLDPGLLAQGLSPVSDGTGGAFVSWTSDSTSYCHVQRIHGFGHLPWGPNSRTLGWEVPYNAGPGCMASDGAGGAFVTWAEGLATPRAFIMAQRLDASGQLLWPDDVEICYSNDTRNIAAALPDGEGGAVILWMDSRDYFTDDYHPLNFWDIYCQRIDAEGNVAWTPNGHPVVAGAEDAEFSQMVIDGNGNVYVLWGEEVDGTTWDVRAQKIAPNGNLLWPVEGILVKSAGELGLNGFTDTQLAVDGAGGAIVVWKDRYSGIFAQRVNESGSLLWTSGGKLVRANVPGEPSMQGPQVVSVENGGVIVVWYGAFGVQGQKLDASGNRLWASGGVLLDETRDDGSWPLLVEDGVGGAIAMWLVPTGSGLPYNLKSQRLNASGSIQWGNAGVEVCSNGFVNNNGWRLISDQLQGAIAVWSDTRDSTRGYAMRIDSNGDAPPVSAVPIQIAAQLWQSHPNPFNPQTTIAFELPESEVISLRVFDVAGRLVRVLIDGEVYEKGRHEAIWRGRDNGVRSLASGTYFYRLEAGAFQQTKRMVLLK